VLTGGGEERDRNSRRRSATVVGGGLTRRWRSGAPPATGSGSSAPTRRGGRDGDWWHRLAPAALQSVLTTANRAAAVELAGSISRRAAALRLLRGRRAGWRRLGRLPFIGRPLGLGGSTHAEPRGSGGTQQLCCLRPDGLRRGRLGRSGLGRAHGLGPIR
jgi:hypothetical protein